MEETQLTIDASKPLQKVVNDDYQKILDLVGTFEKGEGWESEEEYERKKIIVTNHIYLIYEKLHLNIIREIDYTDIKSFAVDNNEFVKYILKTAFRDKGFSTEALDSWTQINIDILECGMYRNSTRFNKHIYH
jgi:hypothetical protein